MPEFSYTALDKSGKEVTGTIAGRDDADVAARVRSLGFFPVRVTFHGAGTATAAIAGAAEAAPQVTGKRVKRLHILMLTRELADLIDAGLPIDRAFTVLIEQSDVPELRAMLEHMQGDVRAGKPLSDALQAFPREFPPLYANMIRAGEVSGQLPTVMMRLADFMEKEQMRRSQVMAAMTYPMVLMTVAVLAVTFLLTFVIPRLQDVFKEMGAALPIPTQILLAVSHFVAKDWWVIGLVVAGLYYGFHAWISTDNGRTTFDRFRISAPLIGTLARKLVMARLSRTLGTLLAGGVPILESLDISASAAGNAVVAQAVLDVRNGVRQGETLSGSMETNGAFLPLIVHMTAVGEETGRLSQMLVRSADTLDFEVDNTMRRLTSLVEPAVVLMMGGFVGFVVLSVLLPIFQSSTIVK